MKSLARDADFTEFNNILMLLLAFFLTQRIGDKEQITSPFKNEIDFVSNSLLYFSISIRHVFAADINTKKKNYYNILLYLLVNNKITIIRSSC